MHTLVTNALRDINIKYIIYIEYLSNGQGFNKAELAPATQPSTLSQGDHNGGPQPLDHPSNNVSASSEYDPKVFFGALINKVNIIQQRILWT